MISAWRDFDPQQKQVAERMFDAYCTIDALSDAVAARGDAPRRIGFSDLFAFATDPACAMSDDLADALAENTMLRDDLVLLLERTQRFQFPRVAAASSGPVARREGGLYRITLQSSRAEPSQVYIIIELADRALAEPTLLYVYRTGHPCEKHSLPPAHDGVIQILAEAESSLVEALRDKAAEVFLN